MLFGRSFRISGQRVAYSNIFPLELARLFDLETAGTRMSSQPRSPRITGARQLENEVLEQVPRLVSAHSNDESPRSVMCTSDRSCCESSV